MGRAQAVQSSYCGEAQRAVRQRVARRVRTSRHLASCHADGFTIKLQVYSPTALLPSGAPGDPATDYTTRGSGFSFVGPCGVREKSSDVPYAGVAL